MSTEQLEECACTCKDTDSICPGNFTMKTDKAYVM